MKLIEKKAISELENFFQQICVDLKFKIFNSMNSSKTLSVDSYYKYLTIIGEFCAWVLNEEAATRGKCIYTGYPFLDYLNNFLKLNEVEIKDLFFYMVERNIKSGLLDSQNTQVLSNRDDVFDFDFGQCEKKRNEFEDFCQYLVLSRMQPLSKPNTLNEFSFLHFEDLELLKKTHAIFQKHYFEHKDSPSFEDFPMISAALKELGLSDKTVEKIHSGLAIEFDKKQKKLETERLMANFTCGYSLKNQCDFSLTKKKEKEYNVIYHELLSYFDFQQMKPIRSLTLEEMIYCVSLLLQINYKKEDIDRFLSIMKKEYKHIHPISLYVLMYKKIKFYESEYHLESRIKDLESYFGEMCISESEIAYTEWKDLAKEEVDLLMNYLPQNYDYEYTCAHQLLRTRTMKENAES